MNMGGRSYQKQDFLLRNETADCVNQYGLSRGSFPETGHIVI